MTAQSKARGVTHRMPVERNPKAHAVYKSQATRDHDGIERAQQLTQAVTVWPVEDFPHLKLEPLGATIGTVVHGFDMTHASDVEVAYLRQLLAARKVIFFRGQTANEEQHIAFARRFGELEIHPFNPMHPDYDEIIPIYSNERYAGTANSWHSDVMWRMEPSLGSILRAKTVPEVGGDTLFADMTAAYEGLHPDIKAEVTGLFAVNSGSANGSKEKARTRLEERGATTAELAAFDEKYADIPIPVHPVIRTHPETGKQAIYVNRSFTRHIVGKSPEESERLLAALTSQAMIPEYQCRFRWQEGSVAFWDNRAAQHYASSDYWPARREMDRVTVVGDLPYYKDETGTRQHSYAATANDLELLTS